jgi:TATA-binding protein-associated factor Taf7
MTISDSQQRERAESVSNERHDALEVARNERIEWANELDENGATEAYRVAAQNAGTLGTD